MQRIAWALAPVVFLVLFASYSFRLGIQPALEHDDFEYTYPSYSLAERGSFGSPLLGPGLNVENRTYNLIVYYYATVHAALIRIFGDGPESIPLANCFHFALLGAAGASFLARRGAPLGVALFFYALVRDPRMVDAARHGRPEMTAGCCLTLAVLALWLRIGERRAGPLVLFAMSTALTAGMLSHTGVVFFALALVLAAAPWLLRLAAPRELAVGLAPYLALPLLFVYFALTDAFANLTGQIALARGNVEVGRVTALAWSGEWGALGGRLSEFVHNHALPPGLWIALPLAWALPAFKADLRARGARFLAAVYCLFVVVHFLCLKPFVLSYRVLYQPVLYLCLALLADAVPAAVSESLAKPAYTRALRLFRIVAAAALVALAAQAVLRFREGLLGQPLPFARLQGALSYALLESGARPGDRVLVPSPFGFHLRRHFDVLAQPAPKYVKGHWSYAFRDGLRAIWGKEALESVNPQGLCDAMALAYLRPAWVVAWDADYSTMQPFYQFLRKYPDLRGLGVTRGARAVLPAPYSGTVRVYRLAFSDQVTALDRRLAEAPTSCP